MRACTTRPHSCCTARCGASPTVPPLPAREVWRMVAPFLGYVFLAVAGLLGLFTASDAADRRHLRRRDAHLRNRGSDHRAAGQASARRRGRSDFSCRFRRRAPIRSPSRSRSCSFSDWPAPRLPRRWAARSMASASRSSSCVALSSLPRSSAISIRIDNAPLDGILRSTSLARSRPRIVAPGRRTEYNGRRTFHPRTRRVVLSDYSGLDVLRGRDFRSSRRLCGRAGTARARPF